MKPGIRIGLLFVAIMAVFLSFRGAQDPGLFSVPSNFPEPRYRFADNPLTTAGVELGKTLFYDAVLSSDNTVSCGSCHQQPAGFTQHGHEFSHGVDDQLTKRNSMPLFNLAWADSFGWDGGVHDLDLFAVSPITNPVEMNESIGNVLLKLRQNPKYPALFRKAFGSEEISTDRFLKALSQFMLTMVSANSRYDRYMRSEGEELTPVELEGMALFKQKCAGCHSGELFTDYRFRNNGLPDLKQDDQGRFEVNQNENDKFKFKVPSLRNLSFTSPYMHDGRFRTLEEVLNHYAGSVQKTPYLDPQLLQDGLPGITLGLAEQQKIIAFLKTLDDPDFIASQRFSESSLATALVKKDIHTEVADFKLQSAADKRAFAELVAIYGQVKAAIKNKQTRQAALAAGNLATRVNALVLSQNQEPKEAFLKKYKAKISFDCEHIIEGEYSTEHQTDHFYELSKSMFVLLASFKAGHNKLYYFTCAGSDQNWLGNQASERMGNCESIKTEKL
ncbi:cytochrome c peroxidase [Emticicia sp. TH156]|uniref:cytochrome c peroxidase n=1 Tax=Emticicia sp. TH156 TaxID=2067454 RepID=UPI001304150F|nr:cytochrome c peroxidase [Emticicia sp. TH156]